MSDLGVITDGAVLIDGDTIDEVGPTRRLENLAKARNARVIDVSGKVILPGLVDSHCRPFVDSFSDWGGEPSSSLSRIGQSRAARARSSRALQASARQWTYDMASCGTTFAELRVGGEPQVARRGLRAAAALADDPIEATAAYSASAAPEGVVDDRRMEDMVETVAWAARHEIGVCELVWGGDAGLQAEEVRAVASEARIQDMRVKILIGGAVVGAGSLAEELEALSVDISAGMNRKDIVRLGSLPSVTTLLPGIAYHTKGIFPPGRELIDQEAAVCLATGFGPEACPSLSLPMMMALACREMRLTPEEAITACTLNAAVAVGAPDLIGSLEPGKRADLAVFNVTDYRQIPHYFGFNLCHMTIRHGKLIYRGAKLPDPPGAGSQKL